ncbi:hypothetical protein PMEGAS70_54610 [Priestia megaterium]
MNSDGCIEPIPGSTNQLFALFLRGAILVGEIISKIRIKIVRP